jgi:hypothetical protein
MSKEEEMIPRAEAIRAVALTCRRLGLLHMAFAMTLVNEFGQEKGEELTAKAIKEYGRIIGEKKKAQALEQGWDLSLESFRKLSDLPALGMHSGREEVAADGEKRTRVYDCVMSQVWREYGQDRLGRIYCYVDPASVMAFNPDLKYVHTLAIPDGDACCELVFRSTTDEDKKDFQKEGTDFRGIEERQAGGDAKK